MAGSLRVFSCAHVGVAGTTEVFVRCLQEVREVEGRTLPPIYEARVGIAIMGEQNRRYADLYAEADRWFRRQATRRPARGEPAVLQVWDDDQARDHARKLLWGFRVGTEDAAGIWERHRPADPSGQVAVWLRDAEAAGCPEGELPGYLADFHNPFSSRFRDNYAHGFGTSEADALLALQLDMKWTAASLWAEVPGGGGDG
jgi:hypothetical protein